MAESVDHTQHRLLHDVVHVRVPVHGPARDVVDQRQIPGHQLLPGPFVACPRGPDHAVGDRVLDVRPDSPLLTRLFPDTLEIRRGGADNSNRTGRIRKFSVIPLDQPVLPGRRCTPPDTETLRKRPR